jgi:hypothetical protein
LPKKTVDRECAGMWRKFARPVTFSDLSSPLISLRSKTGAPDVEERA